MDELNSAWNEASTQMYQQATAAGKAPSEGPQQQGPAAGANRRPMARKSKTPTLKLWTTRNDLGVVLRNILRVVVVDTEGEVIPRLLYPMEIIFILVSMALLAVVLWAAVTGRFTSGGYSHIAGLTAFHDFQSRDKQEAVEMIVEQNAGKKLADQASSEGPNKGTTNNESQ